MRYMAAIISRSLAAVVLPNWFIALARFSIFSTGKPNAALAFAIAVAASSAVMSNATVILATVSVNFKMFSRPCMPSCPAICPIFARSTADIGMRLLSWTNPLLKFLRDSPASPVVLAT